MRRALIASIAAVCALLSNACDCGFDYMPKPTSPPSEGPDAGTDPSYDRPQSPYDPDFDGYDPTPDLPGDDPFGPPDLPGGDPELPELPGSDPELPELPGSDPELPELPGSDPALPELPGSDPELPGDDPELPGSDGGPELPEHGPYLPPVPPKGDYGCTLTQGYWRNHFEAWAVTGVDLGSHYYTATEALAILRTPPRGDASLILARQLIAALLNVASGASGTEAIENAQAWLTGQGTVLAFGTDPSSDAGRNAIALADALADYNEGHVGPGHCTSAPTPRIHPTPDEPR